MPIEQPPLTEEQFCDLLNFIHKSSEDVEHIQRELDKIYHGDVQFSPINDYEHTLVELLKTLMRDTDTQNSWIDYFLYDSPNFGKDWAPGMVTDAYGTDIPLATPQDLYKLLVDDNFPPKQ